MGYHEKSAMGIFQSMFDKETLRRAETEVDIAEELRDRGEAGEGWGFSYSEGRKRMDEAERRAERRQDRQQMLLIERAIDELPDSLEYLRDGARAHIAAAADRILVRGAVGAVHGAERLAVRWVAKVVEKVHRERMDRVEAMARLGRRTSRGTPEEESANDLSDQLMGKVRARIERLRDWAGMPAVDAREPL